jgi:hypothetical protein
LEAEETEDVVMKTVYTITRMFLAVAFAILTQGCASIDLIDLNDERPQWDRSEDLNPTFPISERLSDVGGVFEASEIPSTYVNANPASFATSDVREWELDRDVDDLVDDVEKVIESPAVRFTLWTLYFLLSGMTGLDYSGLGSSLGSGLGWP